MNAPIILDPSWFDELHEAVGKVESNLQTIKDKKEVIETTGEDVIEFVGNVLDKYS